MISLLFLSSLLFDVPLFIYFIAFCCCFLISYISLLSVVILNTLLNKVWFDLGLTQERNHSLALCVGRASRGLVPWENTSRLTQEMVDRWSETATRWETIIATSQIAIAWALGIGFHFKLWLTVFQVFQEETSIFPSSGGTFIGS